MQLYAVCIDGHFFRYCRLLLHYEDGPLFVYSCTSCKAGRIMKKFLGVVFLNPVEYIVYTVI